MLGLQEETHDYINSTYAMTKSGAETSGVRHYIIYALLPSVYKGKCWNLKPHKEVENFLEIFVILLQGIGGPGGLAWTSYLVLLYYYLKYQAWIIYLL